MRSAPTEPLPAARPVIEPNAVCRRIVVPAASCTAAGPFISFPVLTTWLKMLLESPLRLVQSGR